MMEAEIKLNAGVLMGMTQRFGFQFQQCFTGGWLVPLIFGTICGWRYHRDKVRLGNGIWFSLFFYSFLTMLAITILGSTISTG